MCALLVSLLLGNTLISSVDTLWTVDFSTQPSGWIAGPHWEYLDDSIFLDLMCNGMNFSIEDTLISPDFVVPLSIDSLVLIFDHYWWGHGCAYGGRAWARSTSSLDMYNYCNPPYQIELWEIVDWCGLPPWGSNNATHLDPPPTYSSIDSGSVYIPLLDVSAGDTLSFTFRGLVESYWLGEVYAAAFIDWNLYTFCILNYTEVSLERSTWGSIKTSF